MGGGTGVEPNGELLIQALAAFEGVAGDPGAFGPVAADVAARARQAGAAEPLVVALRASAWFERCRLENERAKRILDEAAAVARSAGLRRRLSETLVTRAAVLLELGHVTRAARDLDRADALGRTHPGDGSPELDFMRAVLLHNLGRVTDAALAYHRVLDNPGSTLDNRGSAANNLALIESARGRFDESLRHLDRAEEIAAGVGPTLFAFVAHNRGLVLAQSGRLAESLRQFDEATALFERADIPLGEHYIEHADVLADLRLLPESRDLASRAVEQLEAHGVLLMAAEARLTVAHAALLAGDARAAADAAGPALAQFRRQRRTAWSARAVVIEAEASQLGGEVTVAVLGRARRAAAALDRHGMSTAAVNAHLAAGRIAEGLGRATDASGSYRAAYARSRARPVLVRLKGRLAAARAERLAGRDAAVLEQCRAGLADLGRHRAALGSMELRALASGHGAELGRLGLETLLRTGSPSRVLGWMERTRAAALLAVEPPAPDAVRGELAELAGVHAELAQAVRETGAEPPELVGRQAAIEDRIRRVTWRRSASGSEPGSTVPFAEIRALLGPAALVSYGVLGPTLVAVLVQGRRSRLVPLGPVADVRFESDALLFALRRLTRRGSAAAAAATRTSAEHAVARLAALLVQPMGLPADIPLVVVPGRGTNRVPWSALHPAPVSVAPSASLWARTRRRAVDGRDGVVLVAGPRLDGAVAEIEAISALHPGATVLVPPSATVGAVVGALDGAGLAHLACHGRLRADNPTFSALELVDGQLTVHELDLRGIAPRRVVLAACDSAADVSYDGDELLGFVSALLARGTAGLVASVVAVGDVEAVPLMRALHERVAAGDPLADALHAARATVDTADPRGFVNWCAFTAYGAG